MALQVWLPLNKDGGFENQGLADVTVTNNGATYNSSGKIGGCYHFGTSSSYINIPASSMAGFTNACSVAFWLKINTWNTAYSTFFQAGKQAHAWKDYIFGFLRNSSESTICFVISKDSTSSQYTYCTSTLNLNTWYHVVLTYETGVCKIYLNGFLDHQYTTTIIPKFSDITRISLGQCNLRNASYQSDCDMNDFRIYDHCLSEDEIHELSLGKIGHWCLNDYEISGVSVSDISGYHNNLTVHGNPTLSDDSIRYDKSTLFNGSNYLSCTSLTSEAKTLSLWAYVGSALPSSNQVLFADYKSKLSIGFHPGKGLLCTCTGVREEEFSDNLVQLNSWNHFCLVNDDTKQLYINGDLASKLTYTSYWTHSTDTLMIGMRSSGSGFPNKISDVRLYTTALSADDVQKLYKLGNI